MPFEKIPSFKPGPMPVYNADQVDQIMLDLFEFPRPPRSAEYRQGCLDVLNQYLCQCAAKPFQYEHGSVEFDAYIAGREEGRTVAQAYIFGDLNKAGGAA